MAEDGKSMPRRDKKRKFAPFVGLWASDLARHVSLHLENVEKCPNSGHILPEVWFSPASLC
jgi:hypothetical protein